MCFLTAWKHYVYFLFKELLWPPVQIRVFPDGDKTTLLNHASQRHLNRVFWQRERGSAFSPSGKECIWQKFSPPLFFFSVFQKYIYCQLNLFIYFFHWEEESFIEKFTWENWNYCNLPTNGLLTTSEASISWSILICHRGYTSICKDTIKHGLLLVFLLEVFVMLVSHNFWRQIKPAYGHLAPLYRREKTAKCSQGNVSVNLMFEKFNEIPGAWVILDACQ